MKSSTPTNNPAVIYFDATVRRREKMRLLASQAGKRQAAAAGPPSAEPVLRSPASAAATTAATSTAPASVAKQPPPPAVASVAATPVMEPAAAVLGAAVSAAAANTSLIPAEIRPLATLSADHSPIDPAELSTFMVNFVVEQTGYPDDMVELDADLEADLGIDSITLAQLLGEIRDRYGVTPGGDLSLDDFVTLNQIAAIFLRAESELIESAMPEQS